MSAGLFGLAGLFFVFAGVAGWFCVDAYRFKSRWKSLMAFALLSFWRLQADIVSVWDRDIRSLISGTTAVSVLVGNVFPSRLGPMFASKIGPIGNKALALH